MDDIGKLNFEAQTEPEQGKTESVVPRSPRSVPQGLNVEDFDVMSPLMKAYELKPGNFYLLIADGKGFNTGEAEKLLEQIRDYHPEIHLFIRLTAPSQKIQVAEKKDGEEHKD